MILRYVKQLRIVGLGIAITMLSLFFTLVLAGCERYEPQSNSQQAERYYQKKYNCSDTVVDSHNLGSYALFGYSYNGTEYIMSDGCSVIYEDSEGVFSDNRQAEEIRVATHDYATNRLQNIDGALTNVDVREIGYPPSQDTYSGTGICWHARYNGNIEQFLKEERPYIQLAYRHSGSQIEEGSFSYEMAYDAAAAHNLEDAYLNLGQYFDISGIDLLVVDGDIYARHVGNEDLTLFDDAVHYVVSFEQDDTGVFTANRFKPAFIHVANGITVSSAVAGVTLHDGDIELANRPLGFVSWKLSKEAAASIGSTEMHYYVRNDTNDWIIAAAGLDEFKTICKPRQHVHYAQIGDGDILFIGNKNDVCPWIEITEVDGNRLKARYHTIFKSAIRNIRLTVIGMAYKDDNHISESTQFPSRILGDTEDGWFCEVDIPNNAVPNGTLYFQMSYNNDTNVSVQVEKEVHLW